MKRQRFNKICNNVLIYLCNSLKRKSTTLGLHKVLYVYLCTLYLQHARTFINFGYSSFLSCGRTGGSVVFIAVIND